MTPRLRHSLLTLYGRPPGRFLARHATRAVRERRSRRLRASTGTGVSRDVTQPGTEGVLRVGIRGAERGRGRERGRGGEREEEEEEEVLLTAYNK